MNGTWGMEHGAWSMEHGTWNMEHGTNLPYLDHRVLDAAMSVAQRVGYLRSR